MKIAVHNGVFHADDVFCVALMKSIIDNLQVIRTRDAKELEQCDIVADVGEGKYDHHQADKVLREDGLPYCAFGLLWQDFGLTFVRKYCIKITLEEQLEEIVDQVAKEFITQIDASDNGITLNTYESPVTTLSQIISSFIPLQDENKDMDTAFFESVSFASNLLYKIVNKYAEFYTNLNEVTLQINAQDVSHSHILILEKAIRWKEAVLKLDTNEEILFVVFQDTTGSWRVQTVPKEKGGFEARQDLPKEWGAQREKILSNLVGIEGCIFCHPGLFICGNETKSGAIYMAQVAVREALA